MRSKRRFLKSMRRDKSPYVIHNVRCPFPFLAPLLPPFPHPGRLFNPPPACLCLTNAYAEHNRRGIAEYTSDERMLGVGHVAGHLSLRTPRCRRLWRRLCPPDHYNDSRDHGGLTTSSSNFLWPATPNLFYGLCGWL